VGDRDALTVCHTLPGSLRRWAAPAAGWSRGALDTQDLVQDTVVNSCAVDR
jgi:hypothetical protein